MIQNSQYRAIPTDLQLNGPILSFTTTPSDTTLGVGQSAYFTGIATAQFPDQTPANPAVGFATGTIQYQWYEVTEGQLSDGTKYVGTATTELIISDIVSPDDNGKQYYLSADYVAIGTSPNANNESFTSSRATLSIYPEIRITEHPADVTVGEGGQSTFEVEAELTDGSYGNLFYQWRVDGENLTDGTYTSASVATQGITSIEDDAVLSLPLNEDSGSVDLTDYSPNTKTITAGATYGSGPTWVSTGIATGNFYDGAAYFDGSTSYLNVPASNDFYFGEGEWTIEAWIKWDDASWSGTWEVISCLGGGYYSDGGSWFAILRDTAAGENSKVYIANPQYYTQIATIDIQADEDVWQHTALTRADDGKLRLFINGVLKGTLDSDFSRGAFGGKTKGYIALEHATFHTQGYYYPNFYLQDFRAYKGVAKYTIDFTPSSTSILGTTRNRTVFNTNYPAALALPLWNRTGTSNEVDITDISQYKNTVEFGATQLTWDPDVKKWYDGSAKFPNRADAALKVTTTEGMNWGTGDFTVEAWCYFTKTGFADIFSTDTYDTFDDLGNGLFAFRKNSAEKLSFYSNPNYESSGDIGGDVIPQNTWVHCAVTRQDGVARTFLNGRLQGAYDFSPAGAGTTPDQSFGAVRVGGVEGNSYPMGGYIQDLIVYSGVAKYTEDFVVPRRSILSEEKTYTDISGAQTDTLTISSSSAGSSKVDCVVSNPNTDSKVSNQATYVITTARSTIKLEGYGSSSEATLIEKNLDDSEFTITSDDLDFDDICLYASEKDLDIEIDMYGAKGIGFNEEGGTNYNAGFRWQGGDEGGEGGFSRIQFTMKKNEEYILRGIKSNTALFLYRKASLIAVVGQGGNGGHYGPGGKGGGVSVGGESTTSSSGGTGGTGGVLIPNGNLGENGTFGSRANPSTVYPEDSTESAKNPGQTIKCSKGVYWRDQGKGACEDVGTVKFRLSDGTEVTNSAIIDRGFKAGYSINSTGGLGGGDGAAGGHGATGGEGHNSAGGGGGSGYSDGSITIAETQLGGSTGRARINVRLSAGDFYIDEEGRILILSMRTSGLDPRNLTKTTSKVLPGTNTCIDDIRWQRFIDSANANTNIRLAVTRNEDNRRILAVTNNNLYKMKVANRYPLRRSLTGWETWEKLVGPGSYGPDLLLAWDETTGWTGSGSDYSGLYWNAPASGYTVGFAYYGGSSNPPFVGSTYHFPTANWWILPDGVPDFP